MKRILFIALLASFSMVLFSCGGKKDATTKTDKTEVVQGKEFTSKYICPMHCEGSGSETMGTCPVCKMDYELNENYKTETHGHDHDGHDHDGHDHDDHDGHEH